DTPERRRVRHSCVIDDRRRVPEQAEPLFREREEDVIFAGKIAVDGGGAVFDPLRNLADGDVLEAFRDEELAGSVQNCAADRLAVAFLSFFYTHNLESSRDGV